MMTKKKWLIGLSAIGVLGGTGFYFAPVIEQRQIQNAESIKMDKFEDMKEVPVEILDTSAFNDKNLEKWFVENKSKKGEFVYYDNEHTYILVSAGEGGNNEELIWLDGLRSTSDKLIVGYEFKDAKEFGVTTEKGDMPTLLLRTEGEFQNVKGIVVIKEEAEPIEPLVTNTVIEGEEAEKEEASAEEEKVEKEVGKSVEEEVEEKEVEEKVEESVEEKEDGQGEKESKESSGDKKE